MTLTMTDLLPRVEKGAAWLDANRSGWFNAVNLDDFDMAYGDSCVLGQCYGHYNNGLPMRQFTFSGRGEAIAACERDFDWGIRHGFHYSLGEGAFNAPEWAVLKQCWITAILDRRFAQQDAAPVAPVQQVVTTLQETHA